MSVLLDKHIQIGEILLQSSLDEKKEITAIFNEGFKLFDEKIKKDQVDKKKRSILKKNHDLFFQYAQIRNEILDEKIHMLQTVNYHLKYLKKIKDPKKREQALHLIIDEDCEDCKVPEDMEAFRKKTVEEMVCSVDDFVAMLDVFKKLLYNDQYQILYTMLKTIVRYYVEGKEEVEEEDFLGLAAAHLSAETGETVTVEEIRKNLDEVSKKHGNKKIEMPF